MATIGDSDNDPYTNELLENISDDERTADAPKAA